MTYLYHPADVGDVGAGVRHGMVCLCLSGERASEIDGPGVGLDGLQPQHPPSTSACSGRSDLVPSPAREREEVLAVL